ncbi:MAG: hypothetical protein CSB55_06855 [Candidatus Cloacimonadota bacterium]|nr:MAG: hypothetical protein CSB55_06855 [Candidatus Cloacimonadota bacterium]
MAIFVYGEFRHRKDLDNKTSHEF